MAYVNTTISSWKTLLQDGHVRPFVAANDDASPEHRFAQSELDRFIDSIRSRATTTYLPDDPDMMDVVVARKRCMRDQGEVLDLLISGQLSRVSHNPDVAGLRSVYVSLTELKAKVRRPEMTGLSYRQAQEVLRVTFHVLKALVAGGYIVASEQRNPVSNLRQVVFEREELDRFLDEYVSLFMLSQRLPQKEVGDFSRL
jgi:hypothetical protein